MGSPWNLRMFIAYNILVQSVSSPNSITAIQLFFHTNLNETCHPSLGSSGIGSRLGRNRLWVRFLAVSDIYPMFIEPTITWVPSGFSGYIWLDTEIVFKKTCTHPKHTVLAHQTYYTFVWKLRNFYCLSINLKQRIDLKRYHLNLRPYSCEHYSLSFPFHPVSTRSPYSYSQLFSITYGFQSMEIH